MKRPELPHISEEMRHLFVLLGEEVVRWPGVNVRPMFGMRAFYRANIVFAMLPEKRALESPSAIAYKVATGAKEKERKKWKLFKLTSAQELGAALAVLDEAYRKSESAFPQQYKRLRLRWAGTMAAPRIHFWHGEARPIHPEFGFL